MTDAFRSIRLKQQCIRSKRATVARAAKLYNFGNDSNLNANIRNVNDHDGLRGIAQRTETIQQHPLLKIVLQFLPFFLFNMDKPTDLWQSLCSYNNLFLAYKNARKRKTEKAYVFEFEKDLEHNLLMLRSELLLHSYSPKPLVNFIIRDPKTRKISKSAFRDRIVHHALCNVIAPIFESHFIHDSYANRLGKGTSKAIERFDFFKRKASRNNTLRCYILKADIQKYFENVNHGVLLFIIQKRIADKRVLWLIKKILANNSFHHQGMPLGNLTSQFFANVYLNELDQFVKHSLKAKYYLRYVDDFVIFHPDKEVLNEYKKKISVYLKDTLLLDLHPEKSKIILLGERITFLGLRVFYFHKLLKKQNLKKFRNKFTNLQQQFYNSHIDYDVLYGALEGWIAYSKFGETYKLRTAITSEFERNFPTQISTKEVNRIATEQKKWFQYLEGYNRREISSPSRLPRCL